ncbi:tripartite tricarboxylate transporter substrate binding protein [Candidimonas humi]|uniref:Bug family tripartite tricarboxylate transporter substrate binding protein n=1 Tax=Candidimonas humi TaxID=683355 RepID=A0ABV8P1M9_9BURK|nr:tripartite tricarboxylate transporter substrate-binding protein [Candidimonas humi]MBV6306893.1 tripartite tricarboxylate transporter substrate binding protein [Candidimonas humi]
MHKLILRSLLGACAALAIGPAAHAAETVKLIVPFSAGGPTDQIARIIAPGLSDALGKNVIVDNRGGAGGVIGDALAAKAPADGNTLLLTTSSLVITAGTTPNLPYNPRTAFDPIYLLGKVQTMLAVRPSLGVNTLAELVAKAKATPKGLNYGSTGVGGTMQIGAELFRHAAHVPLVHIPYRGAAPALVALMGGQVDLVNADVPVLLPYIKQGRIKGLVIYDTKRSSLLPDIPDAVEAGMPGLQMSNWYGVLAPAGTPAATRKKIEDALAKVVHQPDVAAKLAAAGFTDPMGAAPFKAMLASDFDRWLPWLKKMGIHTN